MMRIVVTLLAAVLLAREATAGSTSMFPPTDGELRAIAPIACKRRAALKAALPPRPATPRDRGDLLFVSRGMPKAELAAAIAAARADPSLTLVLRGVLPGETLADAMRGWAGLVGRREPLPAILIDPTLFRRHRIEAVPTLVDAATGQQLRGGLDPVRLQRELPEHEGLDYERQEQPGRDFGRIGPTWPIAEPDLAEVCAAGRNGSTCPAVRRPPSPGSGARCPRSSSRRPRPTGYAVSARWRGPAPPPGPHGPAAAAHPQRTQPARAGAAHRTDRGDRRPGPHELTWAKAQRGEHSATIHLVANPDRAGGWPAWQALQDGLGAPAFLLDRHLAERLGVQATPSLIEADGSELVIAETALPRPAGNANP